MRYISKLKLIAGTFIVVEACVFKIIDNIGRNRKITVVRRGVESLDYIEREENIKTTNWE